MAWRDCLTNQHDYLLSSPLLSSPPAKLTHTQWQIAANSQKERRRTTTQRERESEKERERERETLMFKTPLLNHHMDQGLQKRERGRDRGTEREREKERGDGGEIMKSGEGF